MLNKVNVGATCWIALLAVLGGAPLSGQEPYLPPSRELAFPPSLTVPAEVKFLRNHVVQIHRPATQVSAPGHETLAVLDGKAREVFARAPGLDVPGARIATVLDATLSESLRLTVSLAAFDEQNSAAYALVQYDIRSGRLVRIIRTSPISCTSLAVDKQDVLWCLGLDVDQYRAERSDFNVVHKYSAAGGSLGSSFPRARFASKAFLWTNATLLAHDDGVLGCLGALGTLIHWSYDGASSWQLDGVVRQNTNGVSEAIAILPGERMISLSLLSAAGADRRQWPKAFFQWDSSRKTWSPLTNLPRFPLGFWLVGTDGSNVVLWDRYRGALVWYPVT